MILYTYNVILSIKALNTMAKLEIEKRFGQEACQRTCSIFLFVETFLKHTLTVPKLPIASLLDTFYHTYYPPNTHTLDNDLCNIEFVIFLFKTIGLIRLIKSEVHLCKPLPSSPQMIYNKKPAHPSLTSRLLKKSHRFEMNMQQKAESTAKA